MVFLALKHPFTLASWKITLYIVVYILWSVSKAPPPFILQSILADHWKCFLHLVRKLKVDIYSISSVKIWKKHEKELIPIELP